MKKLIAWLCKILGCCNSESFNDRAIQGTQTSAVKIAVDTGGVPFVDYETMHAGEGFRFILVGPEDFEIRFPNESPFDAKEFRSEGGVLNLKLPKQDSRILEAQGELRYKYDIIVDGVVLDPMLIIKRPYS